MGDRTLKAIIGGGLISLALIVGGAGYSKYSESRGSSESAIAEGCKTGVIFGFPATYFAGLGIYYLVKKES